LESTAFIRIFDEIWNNNFYIEEQLKVAREYQDYHKEKFGFGNTEFINANIESFVDEGKIQEESADLVISNCVVNLSPYKDRVFKQVWKVLKEGGEFYFSDIYCNKRVPQELQEDKVLWGECISGALYFEDFRRLMASIGFQDIRIISIGEVKATADYKLDQTYYSITVRAFKISSLEDRCEDYQNKVTYLGGIPDSACKFEFDQNYSFCKGKEVEVCRNTKEILEKSRFAK
jgi:arsenite methyltransferase